MSRDELARRAEVEPSYLEYVEEDGHAFPSYECLFRIGDALGTSVAALREEPAPSSDA